MTGKHVCQECGKPLSGRKSAIFCDAACRLTFNNRRMQRGAELYDLFRALRRERGLAKLLSLWTWICRLELEWNQEDERDRPGRKSYMEPKRALDNLFDKGSLQRGDVLVQGKKS